MVGLMDDDSTDTRLAKALKAHNEGRERGLTITRTTPIALSVSVLITLATVLVAVALGYSEFKYQLNELDRKSEDRFTGKDMDRWVRLFREMNKDHEHLRIPEWDE